MATRKPADKFPLWLHPRGLWCKKIRGRFHYFGKDRDAALTEYVRVREDLEAGRAPPPKDDNRLTVKELVNSFLTAKRERVNCKELTPGMWGEYYHMAEQVIETFGRGRTVAELRPADFGRLRAAAANRLGPAALSKFVTMTRTLFAFAYESELVTTPVRYGSQFDRPPRRVMRLERAKRGAKLIPATDLRKLIKKADAQLRAMLYLGINCGLGQTDCANLQREAIDLKSDWLDAPRQKTGTPRKCPLWPETVKALGQVMRMRPDPKDSADADCVFLTRHGNRWVRYKDRGDNERGVTLDAVAFAFAKLSKRAGVTVPGGFYTLRHTFRTVADEVKDQPAAMLIMGHHDTSINGYYREQVSDERLRAVTDYVRSWLLA
jgi:integrase